MATAYSHEAFAGQLNTKFWLAAAGEPLALELIEVSPLRRNAPYESYSLELRGPSGRYIPQASYRMDHAALGPLEIFIVPVRQDRQGLYYEASFNCLSAEAAP